MALTRKQMEAVIKDGGSVMHDGKIITKLGDLPGEEDLAETDEEKIAVATDLRGRIDELSVRLAKVEGVPTDAEKVSLMQAHIVQLETDNTALNMRLGDAVAAHNSEADAHAETKSLAYENISGLTGERDGLLQRVKDLEAAQQQLADANKQIDVLKAAAAKAGKTAPKNDPPVSDATVSPTTTPTGEQKPEADAAPEGATG